jgi:hypothetical protein
MSTDEKPFLQVVKGNPTPEELAAVVTLIAAISGSQAPSTARPRSSWADPARGVRHPLPHGPGAWRASGLPR